jgi:glycosyltransferase involved in cell wall biosynthesis
MTKGSLLPVGVEPMQMTFSVKTSFSFLLICQTYFPVLGGSEIEAQRVCGALIRRGHRVTVVCAGGKPMPPAQKWVDPEGVPVCIYAHRHDGLLKNVIYAFRVSQTLVRERKNYQFVYFLMPGLHVALGLVIARLVGKPILVKISGSGEVVRMHKSRIGRLQLSWMNRWARKILILNEGMRQEAIDHGILAKHLFMMPNPVDTDEFSPASPSERGRLRNRLGISQDVPVVVYSGRLAPEKALPVLLDAISLVVKVIPNTVLILVGDGSDRPALAAYAEQIGMLGHNIRFVGRVDPKDIPSWLRIATVFANASPFEGFPCALAEAMSTGLASVVTDIPGNRQLVQDGVNSILAPAGDARKIADSILFLIEDANIRDRMGKSARECIVKNYSTQCITDLYEALFNEIKP